MNTQMMTTAETGQQAQGLEATSPQAWAAVLETMTAVKPVIRSVLGSSRMGSDVEDVAQETILSAVTAAHRWDPARGPLVSWVTTIGKRRAIDHLRRQRVGGATAVVIAGQGTDEDTPVVDVAEESFEDRLLDRDEAWRLVQAVLGQVQLVLRNDATISRALTVLVTCDGDVRAAARRLRLAEAVVREARRETVRMAVVIRNAQELHERFVRGGRPKLQWQVLMTCLPDETGSWTRIVTTESMQGKGFDAITPEALAACTGWSVSTARQRMKDTVWLLSVARTIAEKGHLVEQKVSTG